MKKRHKLKMAFRFWLLDFHREVAKTSSIGKKMLTASRTNAHMKETYEALGRLAEEAINKGELDWDSPKVRAMLYTIKACKKDIEEIEQKLNRIKFPNKALEEKKEDKKED